MFENPLSGLKSLTFGCGFGKCLEIAPAIPASFFFASLEIRRFYARKKVSEHTLK
jgi:hypothetical protein